MTDPIFLFRQDFVYLKVTQLLLAKPYTFASQKLFHFENLENKTKNVLKNDWRIQIVYNIYQIPLSEQNKLTNILHVFTPLRFCLFVVLST